MKITNGLACDLLELDIGDSTAEWETDWFGNNPLLSLELVYSELIDTSRWHHIHERVYKDLTTGKFWSTTYRIGATECQDETPYEYEREVELTEVVPTEIKTIIYKAVK